MPVHQLSYNVQWDREGALKCPLQFCLKCFKKKPKPKPKKLKPKPKPEIICTVHCNIKSTETN